MDWAQYRNKEARLDGLERSALDETDAPDNTRA
jgi:hypothetical protein